jgi:hypothetical protein
LTLSALGIFSAAGAGGGLPAIDAYEHISTTILTGTQASITFSSLGTYSSTYKHLQIRLLGRQTLAAGGQGDIYVRFNADGSSNYARHFLAGNGSTVSSGATANSSYALGGQAPYNNETTGTFGGSVIDILDAYSTTKNKTIRALSGSQSSNASVIQVASGHWRNTASITSITLSLFDIWLTGTRFSLYGIKG